jgi:hypothetical protein
MRTQRGLRGLDSPLSRCDLVDQRLLMASPVGISIWTSTLTVSARKCCRAARCLATARTVRVVTVTATVLVPRVAVAADGGRLVGQDDCLWTNLIGQLMRIGFLKPGESEDWHVTAHRQLHNATSAPTAGPRATEREPNARIVKREGRAQLSMPPATATQPIVTRAERRRPTAPGPTLRRRSERLGRRSRGESDRKREGECLAGGPGCRRLDECRRRLPLRAVCVHKRGPWPSWFCSRCRVVRMSAVSGETIPSRMAWAPASPRVCTSSLRRIAETW